MSTSDPTPGTQPPAPPVPGSPEYNAAMAAKFDAANGAVSGAPEGTPPAPTPPAAPAPTDPPKPADPPVPPQTPPATPPAPVKADGALDVEALNKEVLEHGKLSEDTLKAMEAKGVPRALAEAYAKNLQAAQALEQAQAEKEEAVLVDMVGGKDEFAKVAQWAKTALSPEEVKAFNEVVTNGSFEQAKLALAGVHARYQAATRTPGFVQGGGAAPGIGYASQAEVTRAMSDPRYSSDAAYRAEVIRRIDATDYSTLM